MEMALSELINLLSGVIQGSSIGPVMFLMYSDGLAELRGRRMQMGWVKIGDFRQISGYISKMVKDRHIVSINLE